MEEQNEKSLDDVKTQLDAVKKDFHSQLQEVKDDLEKVRNKQEELGRSVDHLSFVIYSVGGLLVFVLGLVATEAIRRLFDRMFVERNQPPPDGGGPPSAPTATKTPDLAAAGR
jgi:Flp pilus assembly protein TadB